MKPFIVSLAVAVCIFTACNNKEHSLSEVLQRKWIDLSYEFSSQTLYWPNNPTGFVLDTFSEGITPGGYYYSSFGFNAPEHGGTHLDAPIHFSAKGLSAEKIDLDQLTGEAIVIDVSEKALKDRDYLISVNDILEWEKKNGTIKENTLYYLKQVMVNFIPMLKNILAQRKKVTKL